MRCFIALDISCEVRHSIGSAIEKVRDLSRDVRWVSPDNVHLTLKFLGEVGEAIVPKIQESLSLVCGKHGRFALNVSGTGGFPDLRRPNIFWVGVDESGPLKLLNRDIEQSMAELGFERETRRFSPHLTIGRVERRAVSRYGLDAVIREWVALKDTVFGTIKVDETLLMKSTLKPGGAEYSKVAGFKLGITNQELNLEV